MSGFLKIRDFFKKSVLRKKAEFSVSDTGDPLILTCLVIVTKSRLLKMGVVSTAQPCIFT